MKRVIVTSLAVLALAGCESTQKGLYDWWADTEGLNRTAYIYSPFHTEPLMVVHDEEMRVNRDTEHPNSITIWAGDVNKKTLVHNGIVIIQDN